MKRPSLPSVRIPRPRRSQLEAATVDVAFVAGVALCAAALALVYLPAGLFFAGAALTVGAYVWARGEK